MPVGMVRTDISDLMPVDRSHPTPTGTRSDPRIDLASKHPSGGPSRDARHGTRDTLADTLPAFRHLFARVSGHARRSAGRPGQRPDPPEHRPEQAAR